MSKAKPFLLEHHLASQFNRNRGVDTWNRLTALTVGGGGGNWMKEGEGISQRTYMYEL